MAGKQGQGISMQKTREIFRLALIHKMSKREIARSCNVSHSTVLDYLGRLPSNLLEYSKIESLSDEELKQALNGKVIETKLTSIPKPDYKWVHQELKKKGVTIMLLWREYKQANPGGCQSTKFYEDYRIWRNKQNPSMRQTHKAGEKLFVDYAGQTAPIRDPVSGQIRQAEIFVAVLGASSYTYAEASWGQGLESWIRSHVNALEFFGGVPQVLVPDNLRSGVSRACRYDPDINPTYHEMSVHYDCAIMPARVRKPKDKAKVEAGVLLVERWILAALRNRTFFSLSALNQEIKKLLAKLNESTFQKLDESRLSLFNKLDRPALKALPPKAYAYAQWKKARVNIDYHVELNRHYYSAPYSLIHQQVELRYTDHTVEIFQGKNRVASHRRNDLGGHHSTLKEHMPQGHLEHLEWTPSRIINWATQIGDSTGKVVKEVISAKRHPEQGYRSSLGIIRLGKKYSPQRLEMACKRALVFGCCKYRYIRNILEKGLEELPGKQPASLPLIQHPNIRGKDYYQLN